MRKNEIIPYLAGIIDGEAYIGIKKCTWRKRNSPDVKSPTYHERIQIRMANPQILQLFKDTFGGSFYKEKRIYQSKAGFEGGIVLDPFCGVGTALYVAKELKRRFIGIDIKKEYCELAEKRLAQGVL